MPASPNPDSRRRRGWRQTLGGIIGAREDGAGAIEFAFVAGILAILFLGLVDFSMGYWDKLQVANGARAGAEYAVRNGYDQSNIKTAAQNATYALNISNTSASAGEKCGCPDATTGIATATCGSTCPSGGTAGTYVTVSTQGDYTPIFPWPGLPSTMTFHSSAIVRIN